MSSHHEPTSSSNLSTPMAQPMTESHRRFLFLDIDGVLNQLRYDEDEHFTEDETEEDEENLKKKKKKQKKSKKSKKPKKPKKEKKSKKTDCVSDVSNQLDRIVDDDEDQPVSSSPPNDPTSSSIDAAFSSTLPCVPSIEDIRVTLVELNLIDSFHPQLLHNFCHFIHLPTCHHPSADDSTHSSSLRSRSFQIVLTTTWRLRSESLDQLRQLFERLNLIQPPTRNPTNHTHANIASTLSSSNVDTTPESSAPSQCRLIRHELLLTPDLKGWGHRIEEIIGFFQHHIKSNPIEPNSPSQSPIGSFIIIDDMDLFAGSDSSSSSQLVEHFYPSTIQLSSAAGFDSSSLTHACNRIHRDPVNPKLSTEFIQFISAYQLPSPPY